MDNRHRSIILNPPHHRSTESSRLAIKRHRLLTCRNLRFSRKYPTNSCSRGSTDSFVGDGDFEYPVFYYNNMCISAMSRQLPPKKDGYFLNRQIVAMLSHLFLLHFFLLLCQHQRDADTKSADTLVTIYITQFHDKTRGGELFSDYNKK